MSLTKASYSMITGAVINVMDYGAVGNGVADDTAAIQAAITAALGTQQVFIPAGTYKVTDTLNLFKGSNIFGVNTTQGHASYASGAVGTKINFAPASSKDLFSVQDLPAPAQSFKGKVSVGGLFIDGNTIGGGTNSRYCFTLPIVIYGNFYDLEIRYFQSGFSCVDTINNRFDNIRVANCTVSCVEYSGTAPPTTDVWTQCTFTDAPICVRLSSGISIRFIGCLLENIADFGVDVAKECAHIQWISGYGENVPIGNAGGSMFHVGSTGTASSLSNSLEIIGGKYAGNTTTIQGSFIDAYTTKGILVGSVAVSRFTNVIRTDAATSTYAVCCAGLQFLSCTNFATDTTKIAGFLDFQATNLGLGPVAYFAGITTGALITSVATRLSLSVGASFQPATDNTIDLGYVTNRWATVYAGTGAINTSDAREKQNIESLNDVEKRVAIRIKGLFKKFKFIDAVDKKGDKARIHTGVIAQDVVAAFQAEGLDASNYGLLCYDEWEDQPAVLNDSGKEIRPLESAGNRFGVRYEELLCFIIASI